MKILKTINFLGILFIITTSIACSQEKEWYYLSQKAVEQYEKGFHSAAIKTASKALKLSEKIYGVDHRNTARSLVTLSEIYSMEGDYEKAEHLIKRAIGIIKKDRDDKLSYASSINILAIVYDGQGKYHQAEPLFKQALKIWEDKYGLNDTLFVAPTLERLSKMYKKLDRNEEIKIIEKRIRSIVTNDQKLTDLDIEVRELSNQGKYEEAVKKAEQSLILTEKIYGKNDISAALSMEKVAGLYEKLNNYSTAVFYNKKAHDIWVKERGADNIRAIRNLEYLAELYGKIGDDIEQNNVLKRLQEIKGQSKQP